MRGWMLLALLIAGFGPAGPVHARTTVRVVETWPAGDEVVLGRNQSFHLRLAYTAGAPVRIWANPYFHGEPVAAGSNPSRRYPAGSGEALGWFFFMEPGLQVDEVRISAGDGGIGTTPVVAVWRGRVVAGGAESTAAEPGWIGEMKRRDAAAREQARAAMRRQTGAGGSLLFGGFMLGMLALGTLGVVLPAWALWRWRGGWRLAAAVPAAMMGFVVLRILSGTLVDPTSHNLWPFEILQAGVLSVVVMGGLLLVRWWRR